MIIEIVASQFQEIKLLTQIVYKFLQIVAGTLNVYKRNPPAQLRSIQEVYQYVENQLPFDLAVVKLTSDFQIGPLVGAIELPQQGFFPNGKLKLVSNKQ